MHEKKRLLSPLFVILFLLSLSTNSFASHIFGGELLYRNISGNTYTVTLTLYGDCGASPEIFNALYTAQPQIVLFDNMSFFDTVRLHGDTVGLEVSPVCPAQLVNTTCNNGALPGIKKFVYSTIVTLPVKSYKWRFIFTGSLDFVRAAGRSSGITNISSGSTMQLEATLNNLNGPNNSPKYSTIPTPFYCVGIDQQYNQGAIDQDGDSLSFSLVPGANQISGGGSVSYIPPTTAIYPLKTTDGSFSFNQLNGQLAFNPNEIQDALIVNQVSEYRGGVLIGTSIREMTFVITNNCLGTPPTMHVANIDGGALISSNIIKICSGTPHLNFNLNLSNPDGDNTQITLSDLPSGASLVINNNNTPSPSGFFSWNTDTLTTGIYTFYAYIKNDHCPIANRQTVAYTINVVPQPTLSQAQISATGCTHQAAVRYDLAYGYLPRILTVLDGSPLVRTYTDTTGVILDSLPAGTYTVYASSNPICQVSTNFSVADSGKLVISPFTKSFCEGDPPIALRAPVPGPGTIVTWYDSNDNVLPGAPVPNTAVAGTYTWLISEEYKVCVSDKVTASAIVHSLPDIKILSNPSTICYGDSISLEASGGVAYAWTPEDKINTSADGRLYTRLTTGGTFKVRVTSEFNCIDSGSITYDNIQPCCSFYYPNAFTPNASTNNTFRILTHGNMWDYRLAIYNRWGQMVYLSVDPWAGWDGKLYGTPCEAGAYYYKFNARCLIGTMEEKTGDVTLIR